MTEDYSVGWRQAVTDESMRQEWTDALAEFPHPWEFSKDRGL